MSKPTDIMAWMQRAYIDANPAPWYRKIFLRIRLFIERKFKRVKNTPGAKMIEELDEMEADNKLRRLHEAGLALAIKQEALTRQQRARMLDSL
jgi:hypothetical protein